jgi:hypothetical protein
MYRPPLLERRGAVFCALVFGLLLPIVAVGTAQERVEERPESAPDESAAPETKQRARMALYIPPSRGRAQTRSGGGTRSAGDPVAISVVAPDHEGLTTHAQPTVYWYLSRKSDARVEFTLIDEEGIEPLLETELAGPLDAGFHAVRLADFGLDLDLDSTYAWYVSLVADPEGRSQDVVSGAAIRRVAVSDELSQQLTADDAPYRSYATHGIWYDSISALGDAMAAKPESAELRAERAALLDQVGLDEAAEFARQPAR